MKKIITYGTFDLLHYGHIKFDFLKEYCDVVYLERTPEISTSKIKQDLKINFNGENGLCM